MTSKSNDEGAVITRTFIQRENFECWRELRLIRDLQILKHKLFYSNETAQLYNTVTDMLDEAVDIWIERRLKFYEAEGLPVRRS